jgi:hypothetical protein
MRPISRQKIGRDFDSSAFDSSALRLIRRENGPNRPAIPVRLATACRLPFAGISMGIMQAFHFS